MKIFLLNLLPILCVILFFGGSIFVHELGHYLAAKKRGLFVPKFSIGFGPKLFGIMIGETEFVISLFPVGGYVPIPQLADLSAIEGTYELPRDLKTATHSDKIITAFAGPLFNILFAAILAVVVYFIGIPTPEETLCTSIGYAPPTLTLSSGEQVSLPAHRASMLPNDKVLSVDGHGVKRFNEILEFIALGDKKDKEGRPLSIIDIERNGEKLQLMTNPIVLSAYALSDDSMSDAKIRMIGVWPKQNLIIEGLHSATDAINSGLQKGDRIISANGTPVFNWKAMHDIADGGGIIALKIERDGKHQTFQVPVTRLAIWKPFLTLILSNGMRLDIIPEDSADAFNGRSKRFADLKIFCNDKNFLKTNKFENGDSIVSANGEDVDSLFRLESIASQHPNLSLKIFTKLGEKTVDIGHVSTVQFHDTVFNNLLGVFAKDNIVIDHPTPLAQITDITVLTFKTLGSLFSRTSNISAEHLMGPAGIVKTLYSSAKTSFAWLLWLVVLININLAILNLLPFPVLDGGLIAIALLEKITGWKCIDKVLSKVQAICFAMLIGFIAYVTFFDVRRILMENRHTFELQRRIRLLVPYDN